MHQMDDLTVYKNYRGKDIDIRKLSNQDLILLYRWCLKYHNVIVKIMVKDPKYNKYKDQMMLTKDALKLEIRSRKLKMSDYNGKT